MFKVVREFVCDLSGMECVIVDVNGEEKCFEAEMWKKIVGHSFIDGEIKSNYCR